MRTLAVVVAFAAGFAVMMGVLLTLSTVARSIWLVPALVLSVTTLLAYLPSLKDVEKRVLPFLLYGSAFVLGFALSSPPPALGSTAEKVSHLVLPTLQGLTALLILICLPTVARSATFRWLGATLALGFLVSYFSGSSGGTGGGAWEQWLVDHLGISLRTAELMVIGFRKTIHFTFYGLVAWTAYRAAVADKAQLQKAAVFAILFSMSHAAFDEMRQTTAPDRTGQISDFVIDSAGAVSFVVLAGRRRSRRKITTSPSRES